VYRTGGVRLRPAELDANQFFYAVGLLIQVVRPDRRSA
jgi:hypothetical protein